MWHTQIHVQIKKNRNRKKSKDGCKDSVPLQWLRLSPLYESHGLSHRCEVSWWSASKTSSGIFPRHAQWHTLIISASPSRPIAQQANHLQQASCQASFGSRPDILLHVGLHSVCKPDGLRVLLYHKAWCITRPDLFRVLMDYKTWHIAPEICSVDGKTSSRRTECLVVPRHCRWGQRQSHYPQRRNRWISNCTTIVEESFNGSTAKRINGLTLGKSSHCSNLLCMSQDRRQAQVHVTSTFG